MIQSEDRVLIKIADVCNLLSVTRNTIHVYGKRYADFPKPVKSGVSRQAAVFYVKSEVQAWIKSRMDERETA